MNGATDRGKVTKDMFSHEYIVYAKDILELIGLKVEKAKLAIVATTIIETAGKKNKHSIKEMDGKGSCIDNIMIERLWRSLKYEEVYLKDYKNVGEAKQGIRDYLNFYNPKKNPSKFG